MSTSCSPFTPQGPTPPRYYGPTRYWVLYIWPEHRLTGAGTVGMARRLRLAGAAIEQLPLTEWLDGERAVSVTDESGAGWSFILPVIEGVTATFAPYMSDIHVPDVSIPRIPDVPHQPANLAETSIIIQVYIIYLSGRFLFLDNMSLHEI